MSCEMRYQTTNLQRWPGPCEKLHRLEFIDHQIKHCIRAYGMRALLVAADEARVFVRSARDPAIVLNRLRIQYGSGLQLRRVWWGPPEEITALHLAWSATSQRLDATIRGLLASAQNHEITLVPDHVVRARAYDLVERVNLEFEYLCRSGKMHGCTQVLMVACQHQPSPRHDEFAQKFKLRLLYAVIKEQSI
jgi:hypothetical protein